MLEISSFIHGQNGIGEAVIADSTRDAEDTPAVDFIIDAVKTYGKDLVYVPTGPLTNLDAAIARAPEIVDEIGRVVLMGGALTVPGNVNAWTEANISQDPDAANRVFRSGIPATMVGLDVTLQTLLTYKESQRWRDLGTPAGAFLADMTDFYIKAYETTAPHLGGCGLHDPRWRDLGTPAGAFLADMTDFYIKAYETTAPHLGGCGLHDPLAVGVAVEPTLVTSLPINMKEDVEGPTRGRTIGDETRLNDPVKTMDAAVGVDVPRFLDEFMTRISTFGRLRPARPARRGRGRRSDARDHAADQHEGGRGRHDPRAHNR